MKAYFEEPGLEIIQFTVEDVITVSGVRGSGGISGFDEAEPNKTVTTLPALVVPCMN